MHCNIPDPLIAAPINEFKDPSINNDQAAAADCTNVTSPTGVATDKLPTFSQYKFEHQQAANSMAVDSNDADSILDKDMGHEAPFNSKLEPDSDADSERTDPTGTGVFF